VGCSFFLLPDERIALVRGDTRAIIRIIPA
jgi:hypothetical protein